MASGCGVQYTPHVPTEKKIAILKYKYGVMHPFSVCVLLALLMLPAWPVCSFAYRYRCVTCVPSPKGLLFCSSGACNSFEYVLLSLQLNTTATRLQFSLCDAIASK